MTSEAKDDLARLRQAFEAYFDRVHALEAENASLTEQVDGLMEKNAALAELAQAYGDTADKLASEIWAKDVWQARAEAAEVKVEGLTRERDDARATISLLQSQYRKQQEHDTAVTTNFTDTGARPATRTAHGTGADD